MKSIKLGMAVLAISLSVTGCKKVKGGFNVAEELEVTNHKGKVVSIPAGDFKASIKLDNKKNRIELKVKTKDGFLFFDKNEKLFINAPEGTTIPDSNGALTLPAGQNGQSFDVEARVDTDTVTSGPYNRSVSCLYDTYEEYVCRDVCRTDANGNEYWTEECGYETEYIYGSRWEEYYTDDSTRSFDVQLNKAGSQDVLANFHGTKSWSSDHVTDSGPCEL